MGLISVGSEGLQDLRNSFLKGSHMDSLAPEPSIKAVVRKVPRLYVEEIHLRILKHLLEGQGHIGTFSGDGGTDGHHFGGLPL